MTEFSPTASRRRTSKAEFWRRRAIVVLTIATAASTPLLFSVEPTANAAAVAPEPVRAAAARKEAPRVQAGPSASTIPRIAPAGKTAPSADALLSDPRISMPNSAAADLRNGVVDPRVIGLLSRLAKTYDIELSVFSTGHSRFVKGTTTVSNHVFGRAVDISAVNGEVVSSTNTAARRLLEDLLAVVLESRPTELGGPWDVDDIEPVAFTDSGHRSHLHVGFDA